MAILTCYGESYTVDHAVKGSDFIHGYDVNGILVIALEGCSSFDDITYDGEYMAPEECITEGCNTVIYHNGQLKRPDGTSIQLSSANLDKSYAELNESGKVLADQLSALIVEISASSTLSDVNVGAFNKVVGTSAITITVPANSAVAFPVGTEIEITQWGTGAVTIAAASGVTLCSLDGEKVLSGQYAAVCLKKVATDTWLLAGALG